MKILLAVQGTGNGHISRARDIIPLLCRYGAVDLAISGTQADMGLDYPVRYQFYGFSFIFGTRGGVDYWQTIRRAKLLQLWRDIRHIPLGEYDLIINDFEPVVAWACSLARKPCVALSHQSSFLSSKTPRPRNRWSWAEWVLRYYAPCTTAYGFHFASYDDFIYPPVIRQQIRRLDPRNDGHYTVYLPAYGDQQLAGILGALPTVRWEVFSKHSTDDYRTGNIWFRPIQNQSYTDSLSRCAGLLTGGGFEGPAEALFLGKKLFSIPMAGQWEQQCNGAALALMGVGISWHPEHGLFADLRAWIDQPPRSPIAFPDQTALIIDRLVKNSVKNG